MYWKVVNSEIAKIRLKKYIKVPRQVPTINVFWDQNSISTYSCVVNSRE